MNIVFVRELFRLADFMLAGTKGFTVHTQYSSSLAPLSGKYALNLFSKLSKILRIGDKFFN